MPNVLNNYHLSNLKNTTDYTKVIELLQSFSAYQLKIPSAIKNYHDLLLFFCAFPRNKKILYLAIEELKRIVKTLDDAYSNANLTMQHSLNTSGIAHTELLCSYSSSMAGWLVNKFPNDVELSSSDASKDTIRNIIQSLAPVIEYEKCSQGELGLNARLKLLSGLHKPAELLQCLLHLFEDCQLPELIKEELYQQLKVFVKWRLNDGVFNRSLLRYPVKQLYYQKIFIKKINSQKIVGQKIAGPVSLLLSEKKVILDIMKASLAFQQRETDPVTYGDEEELELFNLGRGLQIAVVGMIKEKRLALESYIGYMAFKNGVPVSYGGGWIWGQRCKIGVNIFPPFRRGESAWLFCQVLRLYYQYYKVRHFIVKPYQFGKGNPEGLKSGAFWFYYKLGFRPANIQINTEATSEWKKIKTIKNYRTQLSVLQYFTSCNLEWKLNKKTVPEFDAGKVSKAVSNKINSDFNSNRKLAISICLKRIKKYLSLPNLKKQTSNQQQVLENWSLLTLLLPEISIWNLLEKKKLAQIIKQKQKGKEIDYILQLQKHERLWKSLQNTI